MVLPVVLSSSVDPVFTKWAAPVQEAEDQRVHATAGMPCKPRLGCPRSGGRVAKLLAGYRQRGGQPLQFGSKLGTRQGGKKGPWCIKRSRIEGEGSASQGSGVLGEQ